MFLMFARGQEAGFHKLVLLRRNLCACGNAADGNLRLLRLAAFWRRAPLSRSDGLKKEWRSVRFRRIYQE